MTKALQVDPDIGLREILELSQSDRYSVQYSPFLAGPGGELGGTIVRSASKIKGETKRDGETYNQYIQRQKEKYAGTATEGVFDGLENAIDMAKNQTETSGVAIIKQQGQHKIVSQSAANLAEEGDTGVEQVWDGFDSAAEAQREYSAITGEQLRRPRIA